MRLAGNKYDPDAGAFCIKLPLGEPNHPEAIAETLEIIRNKDGKYYLRKQCTPSELSAEKLPGRAAQLAPSHIDQVFESRDQMLAWLDKEFQRLLQQL